MKKTVKLLTVLAGLSLANLATCGQVPGISSVQLTGIEADAQGRTALMRAAYDGNLEQARNLLSDPANSALINYQDNKGRTALMYAANGKYGAKGSDIIAMVKFLEASAADTTARDTEGHDAMDYLLLWSPYFKRTDMKGELLTELGGTGGSYSQACDGWCVKRNVTCTESEPFSLGAQSGFRCTQLLWRAQGCTDTCKPEAPSETSQMLSADWFMSYHTYAVRSWDAWGAKPHEIWRD